MNIYLYVAIAIILAALSTRVIKLIKLPNVTGYLIVGILIGPFVLGLAFTGGKLTSENNEIYNLVQSISWLSEIALGFIAFTIGSSFKLSSLKIVGKKVIIITILEALFASILVFLILLIFHFVIPNVLTWELVLTLAAIASATAPAATLMVIKQYNAKGPVVSTLLPVVALDDAAALILFSILFSIGKTVAINAPFDVYSTIFKPLIEILISVSIGALLGFLISMLCKLFKSRANRLIICIFSILFNIGMYYLFKQSYMGSFELSSLLMCMSSGALFVNIRADSTKTFERMDTFTPVIFMLFFVISGAQLDITIFGNKDTGFIILIAFLYIIFRALGKYLGACTGATITHADNNVKKWLGLALVPQAGVAIGLATTASNVLTSLGSSSGKIILGIILTTTLIYELIGPVLTKFALFKAGEIQISATSK